MVSAFFGQGAAEGFRKQEALDIQHEQNALGSEKLDILRGELQQKSKLATFDRINAINKQLSSTIKAIETGMVSSNPETRAMFRAPSVQGTLAKAKDLLGRNLKTVNPAAPQEDVQTMVESAGVPDVAKPSRPTVFEQELAVFKEETQKATGRPATPEAILNFLDKRKPAGTVITQNPDGTFSVSIGGPGGQATPAAGGQGTGATPLPATAVQKTSEGIEAAKSGVETVDALLALPRGALGAQAKLRRITREAGRVAGDVSSLGLPDNLQKGLEKIGSFADRFISVEIENGTLSEEDAKAFRLDPLTTAKGLQQRLTFLYARALQPTGDRLLKDVIKEAQDATDFDSFFVSEKTVRERLAFLARSFHELEGRITRTVPRVGGHPPRKSEFKEEPQQKESAAPAAKRFRYDPETDSLVPQ